MPNLQLKNRLFMAPIGTGFPIEQLTRFLAARAMGGVAMITTGETCVHPGGRAGMKNETLIETDAHVAPLAELARTVKNAGAKIILQLNHAGRYSFASLTGREAVAPSAVMSGYTGETPRELTTTEADDLVIAFANAAARAREAGFDGVEFCGSSGYLISQFLSPVTNKRTDKYGGDAVGRAAFIISILKETRRVVGADFNICVKFDADDGMSGGVTLNESKQFAPLLVEAGADRLHVWAGWHEASRPMLPMSVPAGAFVYLAEEIKKVVSVPVSTVGRINTPELAAKIISEGRADLVGLARALMADADFVNKAREGRAGEIRRCTACCHCFDSLAKAIRSGEEMRLVCAVNPELGWEGMNAVRPSANPRRVAVVGAGPAGMEAARVAALRGHRVTLYEKEERIGGMVNLSFVPPHKEELKGVIDYYASQMAKNNIELKLSKEFDINEMRAVNPDVVVLATGAGINSVKIPGAEGRSVTATEVLSGEAQAGGTAVVIGGGMIGLETAEYLADKGCRVTVVEMDKIAKDIGPTMRWDFVSRIRRKMNILSQTRVLEVRGNSVLVLDRNNIGKEINADTVVIASGLESIRGIRDSEELKKIEYYVIGSCKKPGQIDEAIRDGFNDGCII